MRWLKRLFGRKKRAKDKILEPNLAEKERRERLREWTHKRRASLYATPGVDVYNPPPDVSEVINRRECPICGEPPLKKCYYCGKWFCEKHRSPEAHNCPKA